MLSKEAFLKEKKEFIDEAYNKTSVLGTPSEIWTREEFDNSAYIIYTTTQKSKKKKPTPTQINLYIILKNIMSTTESKLYDDIKSEAKFKSFDGSFNALLLKGYIKSDVNASTNNYFLASMPLV